MKLATNIISLFILLSFFTRTLAPVGSGIMGRLTLADFFGIIAVALFFVYQRKIKVPSTSTSHLIFILLLLPGILVTASPMTTILELLILVFLFLISIIIYNLFNSVKGLEKLILLFAIAGLVASVTGIWDTFATFTPLPRIFPSRAAGEALSGFRNAGQAGAYMLIVLTALIPLRSSILFDKFSKKTRITVKYSLIFSTIFIILTGKIAAYVGLGFGLILFLILRRKFILLIPVLFFSGLVALIIPYAEVVAPAIYKRLNYKIQDRIVRNVSGDRDVTEEGFFAENFSAAIHAFNDYPLTGAGLGGVQKVYHKNEIHSTYLKMIGEGGTLGVIGYIIFMLFFAKIFFLKADKETNPYKNYLSLMFPFILGCIISWSYTYHIRKREFYILLIIINITYLLARKHKKEIMKLKSKKLEE